MLLLVSPLLDFSAKFSQIKDPRFKPDLIDNFIQCYNPQLPDASLLHSNLAQFPDTRLLYGGQDIFRPQNEVFGRMLQAANVTWSNWTLPNVGHYLHWENTLAVDHLILELLKGTYDPSDTVQRHVDNLSDSSAKAWLNGNLNRFFSGQKSSVPQRPAKVATSFVLIPLLDAILSNLAQQKAGLEKATVILRGVKGDALNTVVERLYYQIAAAGARNDIKETILLIELYLTLYPTDLFMALIGEFYCFEYGWPEKQLELMELIKPNLTSTGDLMRESSFYASYAFALDLNRRYSDAAKAARLALHQKPTLPWALHAQIHINSSQDGTTTSVHSLQTLT